MVGKGTRIVSPDKARVITVQVRRGSGDENQLAVYKVPVEPGQSVLGVLQYICDYLDSTLAFSCSCRIGLCSACLVRVNGKVVRACTTLAEGDMHVEPYSDNARIRDLVVQLPPLTK
jgi:succinate dehydrogenase / fumarate reductase iron-sulfur subunit